MRNLCLKVFLFFVYVSYSQNINFKGYVKDSLQNPLPYANVIAKPKDVSKNLQFAITDNEGYYNLNLQKGDTITISISYLGFKQINYGFVAKENTRKDFVLQASEEQLDEIVIEMPVTVRGDTTRYKTDKFINGTERKLKNVLNKLPGVEVDKNGKVTVQGKKVTKMLVDGKKFFGGNSKLAVENIPADAVGDVEVIDNYNEVPFLKNLTDSDEMAMNIKLKEDKKRFVFGDVETGKGNEDFYKTSANLFYYSPKTNLNFIGNINNVNEKTFTFRDYMNFSGRFNAVFSGNFNFKGGNFSQFLQSDDVISSTQKFAALNITKTTTSKLDISSYLILSSSDVSTRSETQNQYNTFFEERSNTTNADNLLGIGNLTMEYAKSNTSQIYARTQVKRTQNTNINQLISSVLQNTNTIATDRSLNATHINQNIEWHKRKSSKHTFSSVVNYSFDENNQENFWETENDAFNGLISVISQNLYAINQLKNTQEHKIDAIFKYFWEINNNNHIYTTVGNSYLTENFITNDFQTLENGNTNSFVDSDFNNDILFNLNDFYGGLHYKFRTGIFTLKQGVVAHNYNWSINQENQTDKNKWVLLPDFLAKIEFNKSKKLNINYALKTSFSNASNFANRFYLQSYNSIFRGNENLENNLYHSVRIYFSRFSLYRGLILFTSLNYNKQVKGVRNVVQFDNDNTNQSLRINQFVTAQLFDNPSETVSGNIHLEKQIKNIKYKFDTGFDNNNYLQKIDGVIQTNKNRSYDYEISIETLFDKLPTIEIGFSNNIGRFTANNVMTKFNTFSPFLTLDYEFLKGFIFNFDYKQNEYKNQSLNQRNIFEIANSTLSYKKEDSAWSFKIKANNLFNAGFKQNNSFSDYVISDRKTFLFPRVFLFSVGYNL